MDLVIRSLLEKFRQDRDLATLGEAEAFEAFAGYCVLSSFYEADFNPDEFRMGGGNDLGIDVFGMVINGELLHDEADVQDVTDRSRKLDVHIIIVQAKTSENYETKVVSDLAENLGHVISAAPMPYDASPDVENIRACLRIVYDQRTLAKFSGGLPRLHIRYVATGSQVARMVEQKARSAERSLARHGLFEEVRFRCVTARELRDLYQRATEAVPAVFTMPKKVTLPKMPGVEQSLQGLLAASELVTKVLTDPSGAIRKTLFHDNVRDFQGYNEVNTEIRDTLCDPIRRQRFAVLNNGITIVTRELKPVGDDLHIRDFQIVNGGQTCHVLFDQRDHLDEDVQVSVRIVHSQDEDVIAGIVAATNRQTAISEEDLSAREEFHKLLEDYFLAQPKPRHLFYERRSKQYNERTDVEKTRVIGRAHLTKAYAAMFLNEPAGVGRYKELIAARRNDLFQKGQHMVTYYTAAVAHYRLEWLTRNRRIATSYRPALYHLLAAIALRLLRSPAARQQSPKAAAQECERILTVMWDPLSAEKLVLELLPLLQRAIDAELTTGVPLGEMVRTQRFAERVRREVLVLRHKPSTQELM